jgi:hypothetical protein
MNIALPILLLCLFSLSFWLLVESKVKWVFKTILILGYLSFTIFFYQSISSFLGWGADSKQLPKIISVRSVVIKEPNIIAKQEGGIYFLIEQPTVEYNDKILKVFAYNTVESQPRLFVLPYSRKLHEQLSKDGERSVIKRTQRGQIVRGTLTKGFSDGTSNNNGEGKDGKNGNKKDGKDKKGGSSESQEQEWIFYDLKPSYFQEK